MTGRKPFKPVPLAKYGLSCANDEIWAVGLKVFGLGLGVVGLWQAFTGRHNSSRTMALQGTTAAVASLQLRLNFCRGN